MSQKPETVFRRRVVEDLKSLPHIAIFSIQQKTIVGDPDLMVCLRGHFWGIEIKNKGSLSKLQAYKLDLIRKAGGSAHGVTPENWPQIFKVMRGEHSE